MTIAQSVLSALERKGISDVMVFVATRQAGDRRAAVQLSPDDLAEHLLADARNIFAKHRRSRGKFSWRGDGDGSHLRYFPKLGVAFGSVDHAGLQRLVERCPVEHVASPLAASLIRPLDRIQIASPTLPVTWGITSFDVPRLWDKGLSGRGVSVGHLDTGVDASHPTLQGAVGAFAFIDEGGDLDPFQSQPFDSDDHGTHTAATIAGRPIHGKHVGVAPEAILHCAVVIEGGLAQVRILAGLEWALANGVRIVNLSLGVRGFTEEFHLLTQRLRQQNVLPVFAVGNEGVNSSRAPGNYDEALSVGAYDEEGGVPVFSSSDQIAADRVVPDLVAPGSHVQSAMPDGGYLSMSGTSMAAPHISGLAALLLEARPDASVDQLERAIFSSCSASATLPFERAGLGSPNASRALGNLLNM